MGDSNTSSFTSSASEIEEQIQQLHQNLDANTPAQKRALSYSITICQLFNQVLQSKLPADRIIAEYFRAHKKHGSKDRRVIRETLFALFRWYGWLLQFNDQYDLSSSWFTSLVITAKLEQHTWQDINLAWQQFAGRPELESIISIDVEPQLVAKQHWLQQGFPKLDFAIKRLLPAWFWSHAPKLSHQEQDALVESLCSRPPIWGRLQGISFNEAIAKLSAADIQAQASHYFTDSINLGHKSINLNGLSIYRDGKVEIQDLGSQVIGNICAPKPDDNWWDCCSGAGGKSLQLRSLMLQQDASSTGTLVASDIRRKPLAELEKRALRAGFNNISLSPWQTDELPVPESHFDGVLVDAPCSCTGTWRRNPDMRWLDDESAITDKASLQLDILTRASKAVKVGGHLVYATCSISPQENEAVVEAFLAQHPQFQIETVTHPFTQVQVEMLTVLPYQADSDGMFVARMIKN
ncbi:RsmB/NOP family class I SAM-dependent RNA methyltransferase [Shewanella sp. Isolate11]|uniref:RsmB/NOP family class I SAM-dependent RNA methyltransferase n=1 Tax=Shewanella sp. Isolate11 TaxID=2908530 RepID=UPI001EFD4691|nr:RsmB/NOP family class I SAM-dependent RNA methyltransferase [Shewanella sp. Isolate11]MCG9696080.1 RsmB/NOP family class I SAM-dependent RNA methyltransferase [Shewanella sp. Isolate11]